MDVSEKQKQFIELMEDPSITELFGGGSAGGPLVFGSKVKTPFGEKNIEDVQIGDQVSNTHGGVTRVIDIPYEGEDECVELIFSDGAKVECSLNHIWKYKLARNRRRKHLSDFKLGTTKELIEKTKKYNVLIPLCAPVKFTRPFPGEMIDPYLLGVILGDGSTRSSSIVITSVDQEIIDRCELGTEGEFHKQGISYLLTNSKKEKELLRKWGLWGKKSEEKFIPERYKLGSIETRKAIIQGLIDTDGSVDSRGHLSFTSTSKQLAEDVQFIARSLGAKATLTKNPAGYKKDGEHIPCLDAYSVYIQHKYKEWFVSLPRKLQRIKPYNGGNTPCRRLISYRLTGKKPVRCISVAELDGLFLTNDFIVTHNSKSFCIGFLVALWVRKYPGVRFFVGRKTLKSLKQSTINTMLTKVFPAVGLSINDYHMGWQTMELSFKNGSLVIFGEMDQLPSDPVYQRYGSLEIDCAIIDEAGEVTKMAKDAIKSRTGRGVMAKYGMPGKLVLMSNPELGWLKDEYYTPYEKLGGGGFQKWQIGTIDGNPTYRCFLRMGAYDNPFLPSSYIDNLKTLPPILRKRLLDGNWNYADDESSLFRAGLLDKAMAYEMPSDTDKFDSYIGVDLSDAGGDFTVFSLIKNGVLVAQKKSTVQMNWDKESKLPMGRMITDELIEFAQRNGFSQKTASHIAVEVNGVGASVRDSLRERGWQVIEYTATHKSRSQNYYNLMMDMDAGDIKILQSMSGLDELRRELMSHSFEMNNQEPSVVKKDKIKQAIGHSPDFADSFMISAYARRINENPSASPHTNRNRLWF